MLLALLLGFVGAAASSAPAVYDLDPDNSFVHFEVLHFGTSTIRGRFGPINGAVELDREAGRGSVNLRIATASVDTGLPFFDARLRASDLLDSVGEPVALFVASRFVFAGDELRAVLGEFTLRGVSQNLELRAIRFGCHNHPVLQREVCGGDFETVLKRGDFGASFGMPFIENRVRLHVQVEGIRR